MLISDMILESLINERGLTTPGQLHELRQELIDEIALWFNQKITASAVLPVCRVKICWANPLRSLFSRPKPWLKCTI